MKLVTYVSRRNGSAARVGLLRDGRVLDLAHLWPDGKPPGSMQELIETVSLEELKQRERACSTSADEVPAELLAPFPRPLTNIICLGRNYSEHAAETARARNTEVGRPTLFTKAVTSVIGPGDDILFDSNVSSQLDWEAELAVIVGRKTKRAAIENALASVFGYTVLNDISARDLQYDFGGQFFYGKSLDTSCPLGPCVVTSDEISDPQTLRITLKVNGEIKQEASTADMLITVAEIIHLLSRVMTLLPGQIIATGTPAGVGQGRQPQQFLQPGDRVETVIDRIGTLINRVQAV